MGIASLDPSYGSENGMLETMTPPIPASTGVLIVGAGPVGLALAGDLGSRGVECLLIEQSDGTIVQPRMDMVGVRTMEFCRRWGLADAVRDAPYPRDLRQDCVWGTSITGMNSAASGSRRAATSRRRRAHRTSASAFPRTCSTRSCSISPAASRR
jgi:2-polyprenyl-6-methoxyphenol hydroxylase-like FAD-dependent oxidoreductase